MSLKKFLAEVVGLGFLSLLNFALFIMGMNMLALGVVYLLTPDKPALGAILVPGGLILAGGAYFGATMIRRGRKGGDSTS